MNKIWVLKEKQRSRGNRWRWSQLSLCPNPGYSTGMQKVFSNLYPLFPKCLLLAGNSNNKLIIIKLLTLAAEFPNHFEILILDSCGDECVTFSIAHAGACGVDWGCKNSVETQYENNLHYFILLPAKIWKNLNYFPQLFSLFFTAIANQLY